MLWEQNMFLVGTK